MSLSLSSLLNPSPDDDVSPQDQLSPGAKTSNVEQQSPDQGVASSSPTQSRRSDEQNASRDSLSYERRPGSSGYGDPMQLPPPDTTGRKMSSPTLEQYRLASRSPEFRRAVPVGTAQADVVLPPIQGFGRSESGASLNAAVGDAGMELDAASLSHDPGAGAMSKPRQEQSRESDDPASLPHEQVDDSSRHKGADGAVPPDVYIKQERTLTPRIPSPSDTMRNRGEPGAHSQRQVAALKSEHSMRNSSPLREASLPKLSPDTEASEPIRSRKRPAPSKTKKGTATKTTKKSLAVKKPKLHSVNPTAPLSRSNKSTVLKGSSAKGTPANSSPAPSTRSQSIDVEDERSEDEDEGDDGDEGDYSGDGDVYCVCRKPDTGTFMIGCDGTCDDWFHGKCVGIEERDKNLIDKYICPACTDAGVGKTTWKRICRRSTCRQPARIGSSKSGKESSKYCSDECGRLFFRNVLARSRGREDPSKPRSSRRKSSVQESDIVGALDDDLGPRGGVLAAGEIKSLIDLSENADHFRRLGEGVLSPPATPTSKQEGFPGGDDATIGGYFQNAGPDQDTLLRIQRDKDAARQKHALLKDRMKFVVMAKQNAARSAAEKELKAKDYCGYDSRIQWTEEQFARWRASSTGKQCLRNDALQSSTQNGRDGDVEMRDGDDDRADGGDDGEDLKEFTVCDRKKCARHLEWPKLAMDDVRFEMGDNSDHMRALDREERDVRERIALRAKRMADAARWRAGGTVEVHPVVPTRSNVTDRGERDGEDDKRMDTERNGGLHTAS